MRQEPRWGSHKDCGQVVSEQQLGALPQAPGLHDAAPELGASHCQCETKAKLEGQSREDFVHRVGPVVPCSRLGSSWLESELCSPKTEPVALDDAAFKWPLLLGKGGSIKTTRPGAKSEGLKHARPAQKPSQDCQRQSQARWRRRKDCLGRCQGLRPPSQRRSKDPGRLGTIGHASENVAGRIISKLDHLIMAGVAKVQAGPHGKNPAVRTLGPKTKASKKATKSRGKARAASLRSEDRV